MKVLNTFILKWVIKMGKKSISMIQGNLPTLKINGSFENIHYTEVRKQNFQSQEVLHHQMSQNLNVFYYFMASITDIWKNQWKWENIDTESSLKN